MAKACSNSCDFRHPRINVLSSTGTVQAPWHDQYLNSAADTSNQNRCSKDFEMWLVWRTSILKAKNEGITESLNHNLLQILQGAPAPPLEVASVPPVAPVPPARVQLVQLVQLGSAQGSERRRSPAAPAPPMARQRRSPRCVARENPKKKRPFRTRMSKNVKECHLYFQCHFECHLGCLCQYHKLMLSTPFNNFFQHIQSFSPCASHRMACSMIHPSASPSPWPSLNVDSSTKPRWRPAHRRRKSWKARHDDPKRYRA